MIDSHAHIYLPEFDEDRDEMMKRSAEAGVKKIILPAIDSTTHEAMIGTAQKYSACHLMMGLHPCSVHENYKQELEIVSTYLKEEKFVAVGEIGLDFYWDKTFEKQQYEAFHYQVQLALQYHLPIVIHSRNAIDECIELISEYPDLTGVFHCFSGNIQQAQKIIRQGFLLGIGGVVTFKNAGLDKVIEIIGAEALLLETDAPYLAPMPYRGKRNEPAYTRIIAEKICMTIGCSMRELEVITNRNARELFKLDDK